MRTASLITRAGAGAALLLAAGGALAHPGHGRVALDTLARTVTHWLTEPEHVGTLVLSIVLVAGVVLWRRRGGGR